MPDTPEEEAIDALDDDEAYCEGDPEVTKDDLLKVQVALDLSNSPREFLEEMYGDDLVVP